ncbi:50S ribosomal protein L27 [Candidatus Dojkabacteria bacterium]|uniref:Large ribosomal subunit protein bL27 n=1 Tax=Candidatus Dojkabacteria bacterium TaxID=2099670 RepID=A0A955L6R0_9BACT|nr:50S ribosomal protein L27 [Candidatus Dojkabacteria bacterium]
MAHTKAQGAANRTVQVAGKRLGLKRAAGQFVKAGNILVRQRGTVFHAGINTGLGKDHTIFATENGYVSFRNMTGSHRGQKYIDVLTEESKKEVKKEAPKKETTKTVEKKAEKTPAKKTASKKSTK